MQLPQVDTPHGFVGQSQQIESIRRLIERIGTSRSPVLLLGESGTGKEVVARTLHNQCPRGTFVPIDCGSLVGPLMESELFGHVKGAFTGATENKRGLIEMANGGTAFFDEIGDLPLDMQVKLLRLLQEREYRPVGSLHRQKVDIRIIAATHRNLSLAVQSGHFRQDLLYRLNVITLHLPPLRERKEDILPLAQCFLRRTCEATIPPEIVDAIMHHDWPGNVRELQNCMDRLGALNGGEEIQFADLPSTLQLHRRAAEPMAAELAALAHHVGHKQVVSLQKLERQAIIEAIEQTKGDRGMAAVLLGIGRTTLYRKLKAYNLEVEPSARCQLQLRE
jgi:DNA-binding NtrC family response regulator